MWDLVKSKLILKEIIINEAIVDEVLFHIHLIESQDFVLLHIWINQDLG